MTPLDTMYLTEINAKAAESYFGVTSDEDTIRRGSTVRSGGTEGRFVGVLGSSTIWVAWEAEDYDPLVKRFDERASEVNQ